MGYHKYHFIITQYSIVFLILNYSDQWNMDKNFATRYSSQHCTYLYRALTEIQSQTTGTKVKKIHKLQVS